MQDPYLIEPLTQPIPVYIHLSDIVGIESFFVFMDAAIRCHPFILISSFALTLLLFFAIINSRKIFDYIYFYHACKKKLYNKGGE